MQTTITRAITLVTMDCGKCGVLFAIPERLQQERLKDGQDFYCPNGHCRAYIDSKLKKAERQLDRERSRHDQTRADLQSTKRSLTATKGQITKIKKRAAHGCCPCCNRYFKNVDRHMARKHPKFVGENENPASPQDLQTLVAESDGTPTVEKADAEPGD